MLTILHPPGAGKERSYIFKVLFKDFLGVEYETQVAQTDSVALQWQGKHLELSDTFFPLANRNWLHPKTLPIRPLAVWDTTELGLEIKLINSKVPVIYGRPGCDRHDGYFKIGLDIFGSAFFMLSSYEEAVKQDRDEHDRFPVMASLAYQEGFLDRPIVNEYVEILWACMKHLWPVLERKKREFRMIVSTDVDFPYSYGTKNIKLLLHQLGGDIIKRRNPLLAIQNILNNRRVNLGDYSSDPLLGNFEWMMDICEQANLKLTFYFITDPTNSLRDGYYSIREPVIRALIRRIYERGHEVGLHGSYDSYQNAELIKQEARTLKSVMEQDGINQSSIGGRQHFLRWDASRTPVNLAGAGLAHDSTLSFPECPGFRCGICLEYPLFDLINRTTVSVIERPLVVMENAVIYDESNVMRNRDAALRDLIELRRTCQKFSGDFTLLWHNSNLFTSDHRDIFRSLLSCGNHF